MMASSETNQMSRDKLQRIFSRLSSRVEADGQAPEATDVNWTVPHHFGPEAQAQLESLSRRIALALQRCLEEITHQDGEVIHNRLREHYACRLSEQLAVPTGPYMATVQNESQKRIGFFQVPFETAAFLVAQTLHDPEAAVGQDGQFSILEESILADILTTFEESLASLLLDYAQITVRPGPAPQRGEWRMEARELEDLCEMNYLIKWDDQYYPISFVLESAMLDSFADQPPYFKTMTPEKTKACILEQVRRAPVVVRAVLCSASIQFRQLVELAPGDILLLGKKIQEPMDVLANGQFCFQAYPASQNGKAALVITQPQEI